MITLKRGIIDIAIVCSDFEESFHFYHDQLGLEQVLDIQMPEEMATGACLAPRSFRQVRLKAGETLIKLMEIESPPEERSHGFESGVRWLTFVVDDVRGTVSQLKEKGVEFLSEPVPAPDAKFIVCAKAPDGLLIEFVQLQN